MCRVTACRQLRSRLPAARSVRTERNLFREYVGFIADRRLERVGLPRHYRARSPFPWMSETIDLGKEKNFFESRVTEYRSGASLSWD